MDVGDDSFSFVHSCSSPLPNTANRNAPMKDSTDAVMKTFLHPFFSFLFSFFSSSFFSFFSFFLLPFFCFLGFVCLGYFVLVFPKRFQCVKCPPSVSI